MLGLGQHVSMQQTQSTVLSPQILQAVRILQMTATELERFLAAEAEQNPLIELEEQGDIGPDGAAAAGVRQAAPEPAAAAGDALFPGSRVGAGSRERPAADDGRDAGNADWPQHQESLYAHLEQRIALSFGDLTDRMIAGALLSALDPCGYIDSDLGEVARKLGCDEGRVEHVLRACQETAPTGVFARTLAECLALQLAERNRLDPAMRRMLANLPLLAAGRTDTLVGICEVDRDDVIDMIAEIRALDPKPGLAFAPQPPVIRVPDVVVTPGGKGDWLVELNPDALPRMIVNRSYYQHLSSAAMTAADRKYLNESLQKASWLEKSLDQRARTVLRVACEAVRWQSGFLTKGVEALRPLKLRAIADILGVHESTVSRAAAHKTIMTPRGVFEFRYFFSNAVGSDGGEGHSPQFVQHRIRSLLSEESKSSVMSDLEIAAMLQRDGISIARRTVAKYRESMNIAPARERKKAMAGS